MGLLDITPKSYEKYFTPDELVCRCGCETREISELFMMKIFNIRDYLQFSLPVTSYYRCPSHNRAVSGKSVGPHTTSQAIDIQISGGRASKLIQAALDAGITGVGVKQHGKMNGRFLHLDDLTTEDGFRRPWIWSYP